MDIAPMLQPPRRRVGLLLGLGILLTPYFFVWFLLRAGYSPVSRVVGFAWLLVVVLLLTSGGLRTNTSNHITSGQSAPVEQPASQSGWQYSTDTDAMRGTTTHYAKLASDNLLDFNFPYNGGSRGYLLLRRRPGEGLNILLEVDKGQFNTVREYVSAKFDNDAIVQFQTAEPSDNRTGTVFLSPEARFFRMVKKSSHVIIGAEFFQEGPRQLTFTTSGFDPAW